jgi:hypothetical protein
MASERYSAKVRLIVDYLLAEARRMRTPEEINQLGKSLRDDLAGIARDVKAEEKRRKKELESADFRSFLERTPRIGPILVERILGAGVNFDNLREFLKGRAEIEGGRLNRDARRALGRQLSFEESQKKQGIQGS